MKVKILDTETGNTAEITGQDIFYWVEGNGSCDCNRAIFVLGSELSEKLFPVGTCIGCKRFIITGCSHPYNPVALNDGYPPELLAKHGLKT